MLELPSLMKNKPMWMTLGPKAQLGFWLPIEPGPFPEENRGKSHLMIWMEYIAEDHRFIGALTLGTSYHLEVMRIIRRKGEWHVDDDRADSFMGIMTDGNDPHTFRIGGLRGEWVMVMSPFT